MYNLALNCDLGEWPGKEGLQRDEAIMPLIQYANIACGYHAGDEERMRQTCLLAIKHGVKIGAHPSFNDRENFGRLPHYLTNQELYSLVLNQVQTLQGIVKTIGGKLHHVKPHGALYNMSVKDVEMAAVIVQAVKDVDDGLMIMALPNSALAIATEQAGVGFLREGFADRRYESDGTLVSRNQPHALIESISELNDHLNWVAQHMQIDTLCIHSDGKLAIEFLYAIHEMKQHE
jgi:UPF0271 protein